MRPSLSLLAKLAGAGTTGVAALLAFRRLQRDSAVASLRREIRDAVLLLSQSNSSAAPPPAVLVAGFHAQGKSSLVNTACRALGSEAGPLLLRSETAPPGSGAGTVVRQVVRATVAADERGEEEREEDAVVEMVDAPPLPEAADLTRLDVEVAIGGEVAPECVVLVLRCGGPAKERKMAVRKLPDIAGVIRERGLHLVVVLTHKKAIKTLKQAEELRREVSFRARTDSVYFIENYTPSNTLNIRHPQCIENDFDTHFTVLTIIRQCLEFVKLYRHATRATRVSIRPPLANGQVQAPTIVIRC
ncbi:uncharacterized protein [Typha angustifolia]|uniref:uncharacterized protein isoform X1 n=1 Tax=Typha angustifolia TaxID=59011 RepID=UPI003C2CC36C